MTKNFDSASTMPQWAKTLLKAIRDFYYVIKIGNKPKVFCISMQRSGTTSVGRFLNDHGYRVIGYGKEAREWSGLWNKGDFDKIINSFQFRAYQGYEDNPWWFPDFYRYLHCKFPDAKFILLHRDSEKWFNSMTTHDQIRQSVNNYNHNKIYGKLDLFYQKIDSDPNFNPEEYDPDDHIPFEEVKERYIKVYQEHTREVMEYFKKHAPDKLFVSSLENDNKWKEISEFLGVRIKKDYDIHANRTII